MAIQIKNIEVGAGALTAGLAGVWKLAAGRKDA